MPKLALNSEKPKKRPRGKPFTGKDDPRRNNAGAPLRGQSWAELFSEIGELTPEDLIAKALPQWVAAFKKMPKGVTLRQLVVIRAYAALLDESNARLLKEVMERSEGKVREQLDVNMNGKVYHVTVGDDDE
jgi:hypothetical protein